MIYYLFFAASVIAFLLLKESQSLKIGGETNTVFYYFVRNSLEFLAPLVLVTGLYVVLLMFVSVAAERSSVAFLYNLEQMLLKIKSFYSSYIKLSMTEVIVVLSVLYIAGLFLISAETSKKANITFAKARTWIRRVYVVLVLLCSFTFFGVQPGEPATDLDMHIKTIREGYGNVRKQTRELLSKKVADELVTRIENGLPSSYHSAASLINKAEIERNDLRSYYAKAQKDHSIFDATVEFLVGGKAPSSSAANSERGMSEEDQVYDVKGYDAVTREISASKLKSAQTELRKSEQEFSARFELPNREGAKQLVLEVPKIFSGKVKSVMFSSLIDRYPLFGPVIDSLFATVDDKFKQELEQAIDRTAGSIIKDSENTQRTLSYESSSTANQVELKIPPKAIEKCNEINASLQTEILRIEQAKSQVDADIKRSEDEWADYFISRLRGSPSEDERQAAARELAQGGKQLSKEKVDELITIMRHGGKTWSKFLYREGHCDFYEYTSVKYYAAEALETMKSPYVSEEIAREATTCKSTSTTTKRITDPGWI